MVPNIKNRCDTMYTTSDLKDMEQIIRRMNPTTRKYLFLFQLFIAILILYATLSSFLFR